MADSQTKVAIVYQAWRVGLEMSARYGTLCFVAPFPAKQKVLK
jgi:hypothetical protein